MKIQRFAPMLAQGALSGLSSETAIFSLQHKFEAKKTATGAVFSIWSVRDEALYLSNVFMR